MSSLPLIIYEFARSPYAEQQKLAWTGALIVTFAVLSLSIVARALSASRGARVSRTSKKSQAMNDAQQRRRRAAESDPTRSSCATWTSSTASRRR